MKSYYKLSFNSLWFYPVNIFSIYIIYILYYIIRLLLYTSKWRRFLSSNHGHSQAPLPRQGFPHGNVLAFSGCIHGTIVSRRLFCRFFGRYLVLRARKLWQFRRSFLYVTHNRSKTVGVFGLCESKVVIRFA